MKIIWLKNNNIDKKYSKRSLNKNDKSFLPNLADKTDSYSRAREEWENHRRTDPHKLDGANLKFCQSAIVWIKELNTFHS